MNTKFDIGELVHINAVVQKIKIDDGENIEYALWIDKLHTMIRMPEEYLTKIEDAEQPVSAELRDHFERLGEYYKTKGDEICQ